MNLFYDRLRRKRIKAVCLFVFFLVLLWAAVAVNLNMGAMKISVGEVFGIVAGKLFSNKPLTEGIKENVTAVVWEIRLPRILCGILVGAGLSVSGVIFQAILQNPLADPYTLGVSTGASFGACLAIFLNMAYGIYFPAAVGALAFAFLTLFLVIAVAGKGGGLESSELIMAGIIVSSFFSAGVSLLKMLSGENVGALVFWLMGSLSAKGWKDVELVFPVVFLGALAAMAEARNMNALSLGDENAGAVGVNAKTVRLICLITGAALTAFCVSICGIIGFVGLVIPHLLRLWVSSDNKILIPFSALFGGILLCFADNITRVFTSGEIPVGIFTTLIGGPFFIYIFIKRRKRGPING